MNLDRSPLRLQIGTNRLRRFGTQRTEARNFHLLLIPSAEHIYGKQLGQMLTFLIEAQEAHVDVVCLEPKPTSLYTQGLAIVPPSIEHMTTVEDIVRCLRFR